MAKIKIWSASEDLSPRVRRLREEYFNFEGREITNTVISYTTGTEWDMVYRRLEEYHVPENVPMMAPQADSLLALAERVPLPDGFWDQPLVVRRALFFRQVLKQIPVDILEGDLMAGFHFNVAQSSCLNEEETIEYRKVEKRLAPRSERLIRLGVSNCAAVPGHIVQDFPAVLQKGFQGIGSEAEALKQKTTSHEKKDFYEAIMISCEAVREFAGRYAGEAEKQAAAQTGRSRKEELLLMAANCRRVPYEPPASFYEALQACWFTHMTTMIAESYHGAGLSYGRFDQYLYPYYQRDLASGAITREKAKEILQCFFVKHNYAYDRRPFGGRQGINSGFGQLITLGGSGVGGDDLTNGLTDLMLEVIVEMNMLEPKCSFRIHAGTPDWFLQKLCRAVQQAQGAPFLINFDRGSISGLEWEGVTHEEAVNYGIVGCIENTSPGNDLSGTVDVNINVAKAVELALNNGQCMLTGEQFGPPTGDPSHFAGFEQFYAAFKQQLKEIVGQTVEIASGWDGLRARYEPVPFLSATIGGCLNRGKDVRAGGPDYNFITVEGVGMSTAADSVAAVKKMVFEDRKVSMEGLAAALKGNYQGREILRQLLMNKAPKLGNDDPYVDSLGREISRFWGVEASRYVSPATGRRFMGGYLSWNYFIRFGDLTAATPDGRRKGDPLSNAAAPVQGRDVNGPTAAIKSVTNYGFDTHPRGASYTITFNPSSLRSEEQLEKLMALLRAYEELGGTSMQINVIDRETLLDAQSHPENYQNLLVRVTGYNAYFVTVGRAMQDEIIARTSHGL
ncbi:MAG: hypothetical protein M1609_05050 [Firmicutes bacterium]|nr:hypothetical protein [Bacillota bacterium]